MQNGGVFAWASKKIHGDRNIAIAALRATKENLFIYIPKNLWRDSDFIKEVLTIEHLNTHPKLDKCKHLPSAIPFAIRDLLYTLI